MKKENHKPTKYNNLELTRNNNFIDGKIDIFDLLATQSQSPAEKPLTARRRIFPLF